MELVHKLVIVKMNGRVALRAKWPSRASVVKTDAFNNGKHYKINA